MSLIDFLTWSSTSATLLFMLLLLVVREILFFSSLLLSCDLLTLVDASSPIELNTIQLVWWCCFCESGLVCVSILNIPGAMTFVLLVFALFFLGKVCELTGFDKTFFSTNLRANRDFGNDGLANFQKRLVCPQLKVFPKTYLKSLDLI